MQGNENIFSNIYGKINFLRAGLLKRNNQVIYFYSHCILRTNSNDKDTTYFREMTAELWDMDNSALKRKQSIIQAHWKIHQEILKLAIISW